jgi:hypothetical protein
MNGSFIGRRCKANFKMFEVAQAVTHLLLAGPDIL